MKAVEKYDNNDDIQKQCRKILISEGGRSFAKDVDFLITELSRKYDIKEAEAKELVSLFVEEKIVSPYGDEAKDNFCLTPADK